MVGAGLIEPDVTATTIRQVPLARQAHQRASDDLAVDDRLRVQVDSVPQGRRQPT